MHIQHALENAMEIHHSTQHQKLNFALDGEVRQRFIAKQDHKLNGWLVEEAFTNTIPIPKSTKTTIQCKMNIQLVRMSINKDDKN